MGYKDFRSQTNAFKAMGGLAEFFRWDMATWNAGMDALRKAALEAKGECEVRAYPAVRYDGAEPIQCLWLCLFEKTDATWTYLAGFDISWPCPPLCS